MPISSMRKYGIEIAYKKESMKTLKETGFEIARRSNAHIRCNTIRLDRGMIRQIIPDINDLKEEVTRINKEDEHNSQEQNPK